MSPLGDRTNLAPRSRKSGETSLTSMLDLVTGWEDWLGGQVGRSHGGGRAGHRAGVAGYFLCLGGGAGCSP